jgi:hypothetical protein
VSVSIDRTVLESSGQSLSHDTVSLLSLLSAGNTYHESLVGQGDLERDGAADRGTSRGRGAFSASWPHPIVRATVPFSLDDQDLWPPMMVS